MLAPHVRPSRARSCGWGPCQKPSAAGGFRSRRPGDDRDAGQPGPPVHFHHRPRARQRRRGQGRCSRCCVRKRVSNSWSSVCGAIAGASGASGAAAQPDRAHRGRRRSGQRSQRRQPFWQRASSCRLSGHRPCPPVVPASGSPCPPPTPTKRSNCWPSASSASACGR